MTDKKTPIPPKPPVKQPTPGLPPEVIPEPRSDQVGDAGYGDSSGDNDTDSGGPRDSLDD